MAIYSFDFLGEDGDRHAVDVGEFGSDVDATRHGRSALLTTLSATAVEVWEEGRHVIQVRREAMPLRRSEPFPLQYRH